MFRHVSVIIPVYNAENFLEKAVHSVLEHTCVGEVILVEDGSLDNSYELCIKLSQMEDRIVLLTHPHRVNKGAATSRNLGIEKSSFPLISFLDSDDVYYSNRFQASVHLLSKNMNLNACFGIVEMINSTNGKTKPMGLLKWDPKSNLLTYLLKGGYFHTNSIIVRKQFFDKVGYFNQTCWPHEDSELWIRMAAKGEIVSISDTNPIASYIIHDNNLSKVASYHSKKVLWKSVYRKVFYLSIGLKNKYLILRQLIKVSIKTII